MIKEKYRISVFDFPIRSVAAKVIISLNQVTSDLWIIQGVPFKMLPKKPNSRKISDQRDIFYKRGFKWVCDSMKGIENECPIYSCKLSCIQVLYNFAKVKTAYLHCLVLKRIFITSCKKDNLLNLLLF